jgi:hypothetical protein
MGLLLTGGILVLLYLIKLIFPNFIVGVAQLPSIVAIGTFIDTHLWAYYLFYSITSFISGYFYCCASCRLKKLPLKYNLVILGQIVINFLCEAFFFEYYIYTNMITMLLCPLIVCYMEKVTSAKYFYSTIICFTIHNLAQIISLEIRDIGVIVTSLNSATFFILLIDTYIWQVLLYNFYNYKEKRI